MTALRTAWNETPTTERVILLLAIVVGAILRLENLGRPPLWIDESLLFMWAQDGIPQEWLQVWMMQILGGLPEWKLRLPYALAGTLTIPAIWFVLKDRRLSAYAALIISTFPLCVMWSRFARPYALAGLFIVLGWRWISLYPVSIVIMPLSILGLPIHRLKKIYIPVIMAIAAAVWFARPDTGKLTSTLTLDPFAYPARFYYVPFITLVLYLFEFGLPRLIRADTRLRDGTSSSVHG